MIGNYSELTEPRSEIQYTIINELLSLDTLRHLSLSQTVSYILRTTVSIKTTQASTQVTTIIWKIQRRAISGVFLFLGFLFCLFDRICNPCSFEWSYL